MTKVAKMDDSTDDETAVAENNARIEKATKNRLGATLDNAKV